LIKPQILNALPQIELFLEHCEQSSYPPKTVIIREGEISDFLYFILDGSVSIVLEGDSDHEMVVTYLNPGEFFGELDLFGDTDEPRSAMVIAKSPCEIARISYPRFHEIRSQHPDILFAIANQMSIQLRHTTRKLRDLAFVDVAGRIANALLELCDEPDAMTHPDGMQIKVTRQELAKIVGCSREMAGRVLKTLSEDGLISATGKTLVVYGAR
jgi:CRP/FNR family transcriptional regulator, cyclic AMP receptor protein